MNTFSFWQRWLLIASVGITGLGLIMTFFSQTPFFDAVMNNPVNAAFWNTEIVSEQIRAFQQWIYAVLGMTVAGWGVFIGFIAHIPYKKKERWAWVCIITGMTLWFVVDTSFSAYFRVYLNVALNIGLYLLVMLPVFFTRKHFQATS